MISKNFYFRFQCVVFSCVYSFHLISIISTFVYFFCSSNDFGGFRNLRSEVGCENDNFLFIIILINFDLYDIVFSIYLVRITHVNTTNILVLLMFDLCGDD